MGWLSTCSIRERGGAVSTRSCRNVFSVEEGPSTSMTTPEVVFKTHPFRPSLDASPYTKGRKPTPWTTPFTWIWRAETDSIIWPVVSCLWSVAFQNATDEGQPTTNRQGALRPGTPGLSEELSFPQPAKDFSTEIPAIRPTSRPLRLFGRRVQRSGPSD